MTSARTPVLYCDHDDMQCGAWEMDFYEQSVTTVGGHRITRDKPAPGWIRVAGDEHLCPEHARTDQCPLGGPRCPESICDCFIEQFPDDPLGLHPEVFEVGQ